MDLAEHRALDALQRDPYALYARARAAAGLLFVPELDAWLVARDADVREVLRRPEDFSSANSLRPDVHPGPAALAELAKGLGGHRTVVTTDGDVHRAYRAPLNSGLSTARVNAVLPYATARAEQLIDGFAPRGRVELMAEYAQRLPGVMGRLLGLTEDDARTAVHAGRRAEELLFRPLPEDEQAACARDVVGLQQLLDNYVRERRAHPRDDLISTMTAALVPAPGDLSREQRGEMVSQLQNLLLAGHLTTTALIGSTMLHLLSDRTRWELLCAEPDRIAAAVEEAARYDGPIQGFRRLTTRTVTLAGTELPAGSAVFVAYGSANRDPARHQDPDTFDLGRTAPARHVAFGHGAHGCPGAQLGRLQLRVTLELFVRRLPRIRLERAADQRAVMRPTLIEEAARYDGPIQGFRRLTTRTVTLAGTELPAGSAVFVAYGSANRDPARHQDADTFDLGRTAPARHVAFGHGAHGCPGAQLGRLQLRVTLELFVRRLPRMRLERAADQRAVMRPTLIHRSPQALHLTFRTASPDPPDTVARPRDQSR